MPDKNRPTQHRYPTELRDRGVRMVLDEFERSSERHGVVTRIAAQLGVWTESLRKWVKQAEVDGGHVPGVSTADQQRITALEKENRELRRPNEIVLQPPGEPIRGRPGGQLPVEPTARLPSGVKSSSLGGYVVRPDHACNPRTYHSWERAELTLRSELKEV